MTAITFVAKDPTNPLAAMASEFWDGTVTFTRYTWARPYVNVEYKHSQKALCLKYGFKNNVALRRAQEGLGHPELPTQPCCDCGGELMYSPSWFSSSSRDEFADLAREWADTHCLNCVDVRKAKREQAEADKKAELLADRDRLRKKYGPQYVSDCPKCLGVQYLRKGRYAGSVFITCSNWPSCEHKEPMLAPVPAPSRAEIERVRAEIAAAVPCPKCGGGKLRTVNGAHGPFLGCTKYPACRFTQPLPALAVNPSSDELVGRFE
jgi:ssDNA-binding Zn-finger/Zn-ribbon topoisomerase 1